MNKKTLIFIIVLAASAAVSWYFIKGSPMLHKEEQKKGDIYYCPMHPFYTSDKPGKCPICGMQLEKRETTPQAMERNSTTVKDAKENTKKILYWTDPMIPGYKASGPGKSPMGMDLIPVYEQEQTENQGTSVEGHTAVSLTYSKQQLVGVKTMPVTKQVLKKTIRTVGYVSTNHEIYELQNQYVKAYIDFTTVYRNYRRFKHTRRNWEAHRELQVKLHEVEDRLLRLGFSPFKIEQLQKVSWRILWNQPELLLFKEGVYYWVVAQIYETDRGYMEEGQEVEIDIPSYFEKAKGVIRSIGGTFDPQTRTVNALIEVKDYRGELAGNMLVNVTIPVELNEFVMVPSTAVMDTGLRKIVYVEKDEGLFEPREIELGHQGENGWVVKKGLEAGEKVVIDGNFLLDSESRIQGAITSASSGEEGHHHGQ